LLRGHKTYQQKRIIIIIIIITTTTTTIITIKGNFGGAADGGVFASRQFLAWFFL